MPGSNLTRDEAAQRAALVDVDRYDIALDLTTGESTFSTTTTITFRATAAGATTFVDFVGDAVHRVTLNGTELDDPGLYADDRVQLPRLARENTVVIEATGRYTNSGEGMHRFVDPVDGQAYVYTQFEVPDSRRVFAVFEQPDLKATFAFTVTVPDHWVVVSNQPEPQPEPAGPGASVWRFPPTPRLSSYITAVCAGPFDVVRDVVHGRNREIPLAIYSRRTMTECVDHENLFAVTKQGFPAFEEEFDADYPFAKYDQVFVPEFNAGAMENAGCVTITELYIFRGKAPEPTVERRALTILHELAHMWFGDLVTMRWWDDLWLNESFAEWASSSCMAEHTEWSDAWTTFHTHEKTWAYQQDQQSDTHPVYADMRDLHDVAVNFDGITYAKGASVLKQLVAYVGRPAFSAALQRYFATHAWGNTTMSDLFAMLEAASGRDLADWGQRWLRTSGVSTLAIDVQTDPDGLITAAALTQTATAAHPTLRPHRLGIGRYAVHEQRLVRQGYHEVDVDGARTELPELVGLPRPDLLLPNDADLTYAKIQLDAQSQQTAVRYAAAFPDSLSRSLVTGAFWEATRDGELAPQVFLDYLLSIIPVEQQPTALRTILTTTKQIPSMLLATLKWFLPEPLRADAQIRATDVLRRAVDAATVGSDAQLQLFTAFAGLTTDPDDTARITAALQGSEPIPGLAMDQDLRWTLIQSLSAAGAIGPGFIDDELALDPSVAGRERALSARAAAPTRAAKERAWELAIIEEGQTNAALEHLGRGFRRANDPSLLEPFVERYHDMLRPVYERRSQALAERCVKYFYPLDLASEQLRDRTRRWLADNPDAPSGLRRPLIEQLELIETALVAQTAALRYAAAGPE
ncbi:MAG: aminopeptidase N [Actinomycetales bacterium]|nr:MAG: aminopeptidase N [Actinomycetales bacterium]